MQLQSNRQKRLAEDQLRLPEDALRAAVAQTPVMAAGEDIFGCSPFTPPRRVPPSWETVGQATPRAFATPQLNWGKVAATQSLSAGFPGEPFKGSSRSQLTPQPAASWAFFQSPGYELAPSPCPGVTSPVADSPMSPRTPPSGRAETPPPVKNRVESPGSPPRSRKMPTTPPTTLPKSVASPLGSSRSNNLAGLWGKPLQMGIAMGGHLTQPPLPPPCPSTPNLERLLAPWESDDQMPWRSTCFSPPPVRPPPSPARVQDLRRAFDCKDPEEEVDPNDGRFHREFTDISVIGRGQFSVVYSATNKIDQHSYAVKVQSRSPPGGDRQAPLREVFALARIAARAKSEHLVRYFASWWEDSVLHIQTELCSGSLRRTLDNRQKTAPEDPRFAEGDLVVLLRQVGSGLQQLHDLGFVHLDIKPDNILMCDRAGGAAEQAHYKIADLGLVIAATCSSRDELTEGDCRYVAKELLQSSCFDLHKADVFSLGLVAYEAATNPKPLPRNGDEWQQLRDGQLDEAVLPPLSEPLLRLLRSTVQAEHAKRPTAAEICAHPSIEEKVDKVDEVQALRAALLQAKEEAERNRQLAEKYQKLAAVVQPEQEQQDDRSYLESNSGTSHARGVARLG
mmetsp:Transcript_31701/g.80042  ORF Transcript_31701/g.80042 Transcript_31701/m.80042 type:complete len:622 (+) Transcript_31701:93-1958(+)